MTAPMTPEEVARAIVQMQQDILKLQTTGYMSGFVLPLFNHGVNPPAQAALGSLAMVGGTLKRFTLDGWQPVAGSSANEIFIPAECMAPATTNPSGKLKKIELASNNVDYWSLAFAKAAESSCFFTLSMPDNWDGAALTFTPIWSAAAGSPGDQVVWGIKGRVYSDGDDLDQAYGSEGTAAGVLTDVDKLQIAANLEAAPDGTVGFGTVQWLQFKITRKVGDGDDTLAGDAKLIGVMIHFSAVSA